MEKMRKSERTSVLLVQVHEGFKTMAYFQAALRNVQQVNVEFNLNGKTKCKIKLT